MSKLPIFQRRVCLAGQSHMMALARGVLLSQKMTEMYAVTGSTTNKFLALTGAWPRDDLYFSRSLELSHTVDVFTLFWLGNEHYSYFLIQPPSFDFCVCEYPDIPVDEQYPLVPERAMMAFMYKYGQIDDLYKYIEQLKAVYPAVIICGTPPPKQNMKIIRARLKMEPRLVRPHRRGKVNLETAHLLRPEVARKLWLVGQALRRDVAQKLGVFYFPVPDALMDEGYFLKQEYYAEDVTHANFEYGDLYLQQLDKFITTEISSSKTNFLG